MKPEALKGIVHVDPEIMGGTPVFVGTRVPLQNLVDYLEGGESIEDFLDAIDGGGWLVCKSLPDVVHGSDD